MVFAASLLLIVANPHPAAPAAALLVQKGDRIALCGDSITEQKAYSRIIETYLRACRPDLDVDFRQFGWSGETWTGFLARMEQDVLRFKPTLALTVYGMNDHGYRPVDPTIVANYTKNTLAAISKFKSAGTRVAICSPNSIGKVPTWTNQSTVPLMNEHLTALSRAAETAAQQGGAAFIDNNAVMFEAAKRGKALYGENYCLEGNDGVHPGWAGQLVMAYGVLKGMGFDGDLGTITFAGTRSAKVTGNHKVISFKGGTATISSSSYPFLIPGDDIRNHNTQASGASLVAFHRDLNRFRLVVTGANAPRYRVTWGGESRDFSREEVTAGVNLPEAFAKTPFDEAFRNVDQAVAAKQEFETVQIKTLFRGDAAKRNLDGVAWSSEMVRKQLVIAIQKQQVPVVHTLTVRPMR